MTEVLNHDLLLHSVQINKLNWTNPCRLCRECEGLIWNLRMCVYLTAAQQARLLQSGPDALNSPSMLWVDVSVPTHTLMFQHQTVIYKPWRGKRYTQIWQWNKSLYFSCNTQWSPQDVRSSYQLHIFVCRCITSVFIFINWNLTLVGLLWIRKQKIHFKHEMRQKTGHSNTIRTQSMKI